MIGYETEVQRGWPWKKSDNAFENGDLKGILSVNHSLIDSWEGDGDFLVLQP